MEKIAELFRYSYTTFQRDDNRWCARVLCNGKVIEEEMGASLTRNHIHSVTRECYPNIKCMDRAMIKE